MADSAVSVNDDPERSRYEVFFEGAPVGYAAYRSDADTVVFTHTEVDPDLSGHGIGSTLVRSALDDVRRQGRRVTPLCPFVAAYVGEHPEYADLVDD